MAPITAVFRHGVFEPLEPVALPEEQQVMLRIEAVDPGAAVAWLENVRQLHTRFLARRAALPDSAMDIAADRAR